MNGIKFLQYMEDRLLRKKNCENLSDGPEKCAELKCPHWIKGQCAEIRYVRELSYIVFPSPRMPR